MRFGRRERARTATEPTFGERPTVAVVTVTRNEGDMLRLWCEHYTRHVGADALMIFDDNSTDGSTEAARAAGHAVHRIPGFPGGAGFERARIALVSDVAAGLLAVYDYVVFVDVDEFLVPDPTRYADLPAFLAAHRDEEIVGAVGLNLVHDLEGEAPLDLSRPILAQRSYASLSPLMCKPSIKRVPAPWADSSHGIHGRYRVAPDLYLLHLKFADRDRLKAIGGERHSANQADGRAGKSSWSQPGNKLVGALRAAATPEAIAAATEIDTTALDLDALVLHERTLYRAPRIGQLIALRDQPVVRIPARLRGAL